MLCGDVNCPGIDGTCVSLASLLDSLGLDQLVISSTRDDNLLDILATDTTESLTDVEIDDSGCISDLVHANLALRVPTTRVITSTFHIKKIVPASFEIVLRHSVLFASPATTVDAFTGQMVNVITDDFDKVAPLKRCARRHRSRSRSGFPTRRSLQSGNVVGLEGSGSPRGVKVTASATVVLLVAQTFSSTSHDVCTSTDGSVTTPTRDNNGKSQTNSFAPLIVS